MIIRCLLLRAAVRRVVRLRLAAGKRLTVASAISKRKHRESCTVALWATCPDLIDNADLRSAGPVAALQNLVPCQHVAVLIQKRDTDTDSCQAIASKPTDHSSRALEDSSDQSIRYEDVRTRMRG